MFPTLLSVVAVLPLLSSSVASAQTTQPAERFRLSAGGGMVQATESYRIEQTATGYRLVGTVEIKEGQRVTELDYDHSVASDWSSPRYIVRKTRGGETRTFELTETGTQALITGTAGASTREARGPGGRALVVLDSTVAANVQVLLHRFIAMREARDWTGAVPQALMFGSAQFMAEGRGRGTLDGRPIDVRRFALESLGTHMDVWAEVGSNRLMRMVVPLQDSETVREGFALTTATEPTAPAPCDERDLVVRSGAFDLPATTCLPRGPAGRPRPAVVFVHGSGPADRDETIGPSKVFRDLAHGLAERGIASLRYDKRTFAFPSRIDLATLTLDQEVVDDAVAALEVARKLPGVDPDAVFIIGHSFGAMLAPTIGHRAPWVRGLVMLGPAARPFDDLAIFQITSQGQGMGLPADRIEQQLESARGFFARLRAGQSKKDEQWLGVPAAYWRRLLALDVPAALGSSRIPALVVHGGKDVQVSAEDHERLRQVQASRRLQGDAARWFPDLNHAFIGFEGAPTPAAYGRAGRVDRDVIEAVGEWIARLAAPGRRPPRQTAD